MALVGDRETTLPVGWTKETVVSLVGDAKIDASAAPGPGATVTVVALAGDVVVHVQPGAKVTARAFGLVGDRKIAVAWGDGPEIRINAYRVLGDLEVREKPPG